MYLEDGQDGMTLDNKPYVGQYSLTTPDLYVATGFNKWGISMSMVSTMILTDLICEEPNEYKELFSPSRNMLKPQLLLNVGEAATGLLTFTKKRCPHMGCALKWNPANEGLSRIKRDMSPFTGERRE